MHVCVNVSVPGLTVRLTQVAEPRFPYPQPISLASAAVQLLCSGKTLGLNTFPGPKPELPSEVWVAQGARFARRPRTQTPALRAADHWRVYVMCRLRRAFS